MDFNQEKDFQNEIANNESLQRDICSCLDIDFYQTRFCKETKFINNITADFTLFENNKIKAIMECKGGQISTREQFLRFKFFFFN